MMTSNEEKQLLELRAEALRLKLLAGKTATRAAKNSRSGWNTLANTLEKLPQLGTTSRLLSSPKRLSTRILLLGLMVGVAWLQERNRFE